MLIIRLRRTGKKHEPNYRIVVTDNRKSVYSPYVENIGHFNPKTKMVVLNKEKALEWMGKGAKPSNTVAKIFEKEGLKHKSIKIKKFRAVSKVELEVQKAAEDAQKAKEQAEKEAAKAAFEEKVEQEKAAAPKEDKLQEMAEESIAEVKEEASEAPLGKQSTEAESEGGKNKPEEKSPSAKATGEKPVEEPKKPRG